MFKRYGGRHSVRNVDKRKRGKRDVLSYEDVPLEEYNDERTQISKDAVKRILIIAAVLVVTGLIIFAVANRDALSPDKLGHWFKYDVLGSSDDGFPAEIIGSNVSIGNFKCDGDISYVSDTAFASISSTGNEIGYNQHSFSSPVMETAADKVIIYNLGGNGYVVGTKDKLKDIKDTDNYVITADINSRGDYCVVTQTDGYLSKLHVFNSEGEKIYAYSFADYYINSVSLNPNGTGCVACGVAGDNGSLLGIAYVLDFASEAPVATFALDETVVYECEYFNSGSVCIIGSTASYTLDIRGARLNEVEYGNKQLTAFDINPDTNSFVLSLSRSADGRKCSVNYVNINGEILNVNDTNREIHSISLYKNRIAVLDSNKAYLFDTEGNLLSKTDAGTGSKAVALDSTDTAYVLGINEIRRLVFQ
ncbi:MAG: DUF5711 family protein [Ruminococcus sp.]|jgi:hypothetical protein|nr:DUF5711 family protein [Ruminococcus sp.]